jgi:hypothetical protein
LIDALEPEDLEGAKTVLSFYFQKYADKLRSDAG